LLEDLQLWGFLFNELGQAQGADADVLTLINRNCKRILVLNLTNCELSASILRSIAGMESLKTLALHNCRDITDVGIAVLATMKLVTLCINVFQIDGLTGASLQSFVGSNISQTLQTFELSVYSYTTTPIDDVRVATALASCHNLKYLSVKLASDRCEFGRSGLDGMQAMATGCPLLTYVSLCLTIPGIHFLGAHFTNLRTCTVLNRRVGGAPTPEGFPSIEELQTLYPTITWK
jgi:hypothetical protein